MMPPCGTASIQASWKNFRIAVIGALLLGLQLQIVVPIGLTGIKLSPADLVAGLLACLLVCRKIASPREPVSASPWLGPALIAATCALVFGTVTSFQRLGYVSNWAIGSKLTGWVALLCYLCAGLWIGSIAVESRRRAIAILLATTLGTGLMSVLLSVDLAPFPFIPHSLVHFPVHGFVGNRNAFAFLQLMAFAFLLALGWFPRILLSERTREALLGLAGVIVFFSGSRSGVSAFAVMTVVALAVGALRLPTLLRACIFALSWWLVIEILRIGCIWLVRSSGMAEVPAMGPFGTGLPPFFVEKTPIALIDSTGGSSDGERWTSVKGAITMWLEAPLLGVGLGSFVETYTTRTGHPLIIHNTALWLLTETGLLGLSVFLALGWTLVRPLFPVRRENIDFGTVARLAALMLALAFALMAQVHEMMYQRGLWLVLGLALAIPRQKDSAPCAD